MRQRGITLIEVLVASMLSAVIAASLATAFAVTVNHQKSFETPRQDFETVAFFEDRVRNLLTKATFSTDATQTTYFVGDSVGGDANSSDRLMFTVIGLKPNGSVVASDETDFTKRNQSFGTVGGVTEVAISTTPVGDAAGRQGLFIRRQTPADSDHENGGYESMMSDQVANVTYEFWDSTAWVATWDTASESRLPSAVRVHYFLNSDPDQEHIFVVRLPNAQGTDPGQTGQSTTGGQGT